MRQHRQHNMKKRIVRITALLLITAVITYAAGGFRLGSRNSTAYAVGDLTIDWGVPTGDPIYTLNNMMPGDEETRVVDVTNNAPSIRPVGVRGIKTSETGDLSGALTIEIAEGATTLYGPKPLSDFFTDSSGPFGISLSQLDPGEDTTYTFTVTFPPDTGNEFQGKSVVFDLKIGISLEVPFECRTTAELWNPIFGTSGNDNITGTKGNDIIVGFEGDDRISGKEGSDCIIGGDGKDRIDGNDRDDVIFGDDGDDILNGNDGNDRMFGGEGNDRLIGRNGNDYIEGNEGDDTMRGRNGDDTLIGGDGNDRANGSNGTDTCDAEIETNCEL